MRASKLGLGWVLLVGVGCGGGSAKDAGTTDAGGTLDSGSPDAGPGDAGVRDGGSFDTAIPISIGGAATLGVLVNDATKDYYVVTLNQGDRVVFLTQTEATSNNNGSVIDTVVTLWSSSRVQVAQDDDAWPRFSTDSTLYFQAASSGIYYVTVEDCHSAFNGTGCSSTTITDFRYKLETFAVSSGNFPELNASSTQDGGTAQAQAVTYKAVTGGQTGQYYSDVIDGTFRSTTDTHVFSFTPPTNTQVTAGERARAELFVQPIGPNNGDGSTSNAKVWVTDSTGTTVVAQASQSNYRDGDNATNGPLDLSVPVTLGQQYFLFVQNAAATSNPTSDYYFTQHFVGSWFYGQAEGSAVNDTLATALVLTTPTGATSGSYFVDGDISPPTDVDWFEADPITGTKTVDLSCRAVRAGSGVQGLTATLYDATGTTVIGSIGPETATADLYAQSITVPANTTKAFLKVSATGQDATNTGTFYWCSVVYSTM
jgi:hypothetical protein